METIAAWLLRSYHWLTLIGLVVMLLGILYSSYSFLDPRHYVLRALSRTFLLALIYILIGSLVFGILGLVLVFVVSILNFFYTNYRPSLFSSIILIINFILAGSAEGLLFGTVLGGLLGELPLAYRKTKPVRFLLRKILLWLLISISSGIFLGMLFVFTDASSSNADVVSTGIQMILVSVPISILLATLGGMISDVLLKQPKLYITTIKRKDHQGNLYDYPRWRHGKNGTRFMRNFLVGAISGGLSWGCVFGYNQWIIESEVASSLQTSLNWSVVVLIASFTFLVGGVTVGLFLASAYTFGPLLTFYVEKWLSERRSGQVGLILALIGTIISTLASLFSS